MRRMRPRNKPEIFKRRKRYFCFAFCLPLPDLPSYRSHADNICGFPARKFGGFPCRLSFVFGRSYDFIPNPLHIFLSSAHVLNASENNISPSGLAPEAFAVTIICLMLLVCQRGSEFGHKKSPVLMFRFGD